MKKHEHEHEHADAADAPAPAKTPDAPKAHAPEQVGRVEFETVDGLPNGAATYTQHPAMRDRVLVWRRQLHEQNHQLADGTWVYRATHTSGYGAEERDPALVPIKED